MMFLIVGTTNLTDQNKGSILDGLNQAQRDAAGTIDGALLILAGPGSGKTRVLTHRIAYMLGEAPTPIAPYHILAVTFTNKAAKEMKDRLENLLTSNAGLGKTLADSLTVGTFHSFCVRVLRVEASNIGLNRNFAIYDGDDQETIVKSAMSSLGISDKSYSPRASLSGISAAKSNLWTPRELQQRAQTYWEELVGRIYEKYDELMRINQALDFDDLINVTVRLFYDNPKVLERYQERYRYIMVDEYQDTNQAQYQLINMLAKKYRNLCVVGDPNQSIYSFRSADIRNILNFEKDYPEAKIISLEQNYRSTQIILDAATTVIQNNFARKDIKLYTDNGEGVPIQVFEAYNETEEASFVANEIERGIARDQFKARDVAILYRTNAQSRLFEEMFVRRGMRYQLIGGTRFYERKEVKDSLAFLRLIANPYDTISFSRIINNTPTGKGIGEKTLTSVVNWANSVQLPVYVALQLLQSQAADALTRKNNNLPPPEDDDDLLPPLEIPSKSRNMLFEAINLIAAFIKARDEMSITALFDFVMKKSGYLDSLKDGGENELERLPNVMQLREATVKYDHLPGEEGLTEFLQEVALISDVDRFDPDADAVTMITLHAAKGLEFPIVFIVGMEEGILPHSRSLEKVNDMEEERRLFYVGLTRAKKRLYLIYAFRRRSYQGEQLTKRSRFVDEVPRELTMGFNQKSPRTDTGQGKLWASANSQTSWGGKPAFKPVTNSHNNIKPTRPAGKIDNGSTQYKAGEKVRHAKFGKGIVVTSKVSGDDEQVTVAFESEGIKHLMASFAKLEKL
jgi:DNA helicase II / ATP-dependent DNA helicase PcrA